MDKKFEYWQCPENWPKDRSGKNMFLLEVLCIVGSASGDWAALPGFFEVRGAPLPVSVADATPQDLWRAHRILCSIVYDHAPKYTDVWFQTSDGPVQGLCPVLTEGDLFRASIAVDHGVVPNSGKAFIDAVDLIANGIARQELVCVAQSKNATMFQPVPSHTWNVELAMLLPRFAFGEMTLSNALSKDPRGPDRLFVDRESVNTFLDQHNLRPNQDAVEREALISHLVKARFERVKATTRKELYDARPGRFKGVGVTAFKSAFIEAGKRCGGAAPKGGAPRK